MHLLTEEKFDIFKKFIVKILYSNLEESLVFTHHEMNYLFRVGYERSENRMGFDKVVFDFEFSQHYDAIYQSTKFYLKFYEIYQNENVKKLRIRYNEDSGVYNNTVLNFNKTNLNRLFQKTNLNLSKSMKLGYEQNIFYDLHLLLNYDIENIICIFEKKLLLV